ncbi:MAG: hypothetical protein GY754_02135 [bacterium]|nr:hypothetical protein [bacterium]
MADQIKTVTDRSQFAMLFKNFFMGKEIFLKTKSGNIKIQFLGYLDEHAAFRIPLVKNVPETVVVFVRNTNSTINLALTFFEKNEDTFTFNPIKFQILSVARKEDRQSMGVEGEGTNVIYISNIMSEDIVKNSLTHSQKKIDQIEEIVRFDLEKQFEKIKIYFITKGKNDIRLKHFLEDRTPLFIGDLNSQPGEDDEKMFNYYINEIYSKDHQLARGNLYISEISVPILYRSMIMFGYIQVNNSTAMTDGLVAVVRRISIVVDQLCKKNKVFPETEAKFLVSNLSKSGLGVVFKERRLAAYFRQDGFITFDIMLPTRKKAVIGARVRHVEFMDNGIIKAGAEITMMDKTSRSNYDEFVSTIKA